MIRYAYINNQVLSLYRNMDTIEFPFDPCSVLKYTGYNARFLSYQKYAEITQYTVDEIIEMCGSKYGCTQADMNTNRFLVLYNESPLCTVPGRTKWTIAHEVGHIVLGHFNYIDTSTLASGDKISNKDFELEADYFAATLLCPMPLFKTLGITSTKDIQSTFGLSCEASNYRWNNYLKWQSGHKKTAFENDLIRTYLLRRVSPSSECTQD